MVAKFAAFSRMEQCRIESGTVEARTRLLYGEEYVTVDAKRPDLGH